MNYLSTRIAKWAAALLAVGIGVTLAPDLWGQAQAQSPGTAPAASAAPVSAGDTQKRLQELEKEVTLLQSEITSLKDQTTPGLKAAAYAQPASPAAEPAPTPAPPAAELASEPPAADAPQKVSLASLLGPTTISGFIDAYYGYNANHPFDNLSGFRFFDANTNAFSLNMMEAIVDKAPDATSADSRFGYHFATGYGQAAAIVNGTDLAFNGYGGGASTDNFYIKEAYGSYLAPIGKGLRIDIGKFVTSNGAEVIETNGNWNYSRSLLFYYAIPYFHFGARATYVFNPKWSLSGYIINGWNNTFISHTAGVGQSSGMMYAASLAWTPNAKWSLTQNYYAGPVIDAYTYPAANRTINDWKQLSDTVIAYTPNAKWAFMVNGDYGFGPRTYDVFETPITRSPAATWWGPAGYVKYAFNAKSYFAARYEYLEDPNGYIGLLGGTPGHAQEATGTYAYNVTSGLQVRAEYRYDFAGVPFFEYGNIPFDRKQQSTATLGFIYSFSSANAK